MTPKQRELAIEANLADARYFLKQAEEATFFLSKAKYLAGAITNVLRAAWVYSNLEQPDG